MNVFVAAHKGSLEIACPGQKLSVQEGRRTPKSYSWEVAAICVTFALVLQYIVYLISRDLCEPALTAFDFLGFSVVSAVLEEY